MALPFLDPKKMNQGVMNRRAGPTTPESESKSSDVNPDLVQAMEDALIAMDSRDVKEMARIFQAAFMICTSADYPDESLESEE